MTTNTKAPKSLKSVTSAVETINFRTAQKYMSANRGNRPLNMHHVIDLAGRQSRGEWGFNGADAIVFDTEGNLRNGQHRLQMVLMTNKPIDALVVRGVDPETFAFFDDGKSRSIGDVLFINEESEPGTLGSTLDRSWRYLASDMMGRPPAKTELLLLLEKHADFRQSVAHCTRLFIGTNIKDRPLICAFHWLTSKVDQQKADQFAEGFIKGKYQSDKLETDPVYVLREQFHRYRMRSNVPPLTRAQRMSFFVRAFNKNGEPQLKRYQLTPPRGPFVPIKGFPKDLHFDPARTELARIHKTLEDVEAATYDD